MGDKGASGSPAAESTAQRLVGELSPLGPVESKKMFGGHGLFCESVMFGLVDPQGAPFLRADGVAQRFQDLGSHKHGRMPYWSIPAVVLDDQDELVRWATEALGVALAHKKE